MHCRAFNSRNQSFQRLAENRLLFVAHYLPAPVGVADQPRRVCDQNQALRVVQDFAGEVPLSLQLGLVGFQAADVKHQAAILRDSSLGVTDRECIDQDVHRAAVLSLQDLLAIAQCSLPLHMGKECLVLFWSGKHLLPRIAMQKLFPTVVAEHPNQGVVDFDESAIRATEKQAFLDVVEQFAVAAFGLTPVSDVLQDMDRLQSFTAGGVYL